MERLTVVIEYDNEVEQPTFYADMECLGGKVVAVQFNDALAEIEKAEEKVDVRRGQMINTKEFGMVKFIGFDNYMGSVTAKLECANGRTRYKSISEVEDQGYSLIDN